MMRLMMLLPQSSGSGSCWHAEKVDRERSRLKCVTDEMKQEHEKQMMMAEEGMREMRKVQLRGGV